MTVAMMQERLPYVRFETRAVEDREASVREGRYMVKNTDFVIIQPAGAKDTIEKPAAEWLQTFNHPSRMQIGAQYRAMFDAWKSGNEIPEVGTPIKTWPVISPAEATNIINANVRTVEDLADANEQSLMRIGMGARALKQKAQAWLDAAKDTGKAAAELDALRVKVEDQGKLIAEQQAELDQLRVKRGRPPKQKVDEDTE